MRPDRAAGRSLMSMSFAEAHSFCGSSDFSTLVTAVRGEAAMPRKFEFRVCLFFVSVLFFVFFSFKTMSD